jgi:amidase
MAAGLPATWRSEEDDVSDSRAMSPPEVCRQSALAQRALIANRQVSCLELLETTLGWIERVNPTVNALCTLVPELARVEARRLDARLAAGEDPGPLAGLPIAIKDLVETKGIRTTYGSPLFADHVPDVDALHVARLKAAGAVVIGKSNTPEWGAGSQTFNTLFGATATPYDPGRTAGGSSGGAAAALAARMLSVADGSDLGGSLRNPAAFCNVVGFRPTPGRVPALERPGGWNPLPVLGPMARNVADLALLLAAMAGPDPRDPLSLTAEPADFGRPLEEALPGPRPRVAWSADLGFLPLASEVRDVFESARGHFEEAGCRVVDAAPDLRDAPDVFQTLRAHGFVGRFAGYYAEQRDRLKDTVQWNTRRGLEQTTAEVAHAEAQHTVIYRRMLAFFADHDYLVLPATQVLPFDKTQDWVREIEGVRFENYLQWMEICSVITLSGAPVLAMPCGFSSAGLPVGLQIVGRPGRDLEVLALGQAYERVTGYAAKEPDYGTLVSSAPSRSG